MKAKTIIYLVIVVLFLILLIQNTVDVHFKIYFWETAVSRRIANPVILIIVYLLGYLVGRTRKKKNANPES